MVAEPRTWVDVEGAVRQWARDHVVNAEGKVFFAANDEVDKKGNPQIVLRRIGGPDDACMIQFDVWARTKAEAAGLASELATAADLLARYTHEDVVLHGAAVESARWLPDEDSGAARYVVDIIITATAGSEGAS